MDTHRPSSSSTIEAMSEEILARLRSAIDGAGLWEELDTDWLLLDAEIMPWSAKAGSLIESQYAPVAEIIPRSVRGSSRSFHPRRRTRSGYRGRFLVTGSPTVAIVQRCMARPGRLMSGRYLGSST